MSTRRESTVRPATRFSWALPAWGLIGAVIVVLPEMLDGDGFFVSAAMAIVVSLIILAILVTTVRSQRRAALTMLAIFLAGTLFLNKNIGDDVRWTGRWLFHSGAYKAAVLAQPDPRDGDLKHMEWDTWGFMAMDTSVYLVFDPNDALSAAAKDVARDSPVKYRGIPCAFHTVHRLEKYWYSVVYYTDTDWNHCT